MSVRQMKGYTIIFLKMEYYFTFKRNEVRTQGAIRMSVEDMLPSRISQIGKRKYCQPLPQFYAELSSAQASSSICMDSWHKSSQILLFGECAKSLPPCPTLRPCGLYSVHGISQARILEWVSIAFSKGSSQPRDWTHISYIGRRILYQWATSKAPTILLWRYLYE